MERLESKTKPTENMCFHRMRGQVAHHKPPKADNWEKPLEHPKNWVQGKCWGAWCQRSGTQSPLAIAGNVVSL